MCECYIMYAHKKSMTFTKPIFMELKNAQQQYVQNPYTKFYPNQIINMESVDIN